MRERGMLFSAPMVRALLAGTKTQTRRAVKGKPLDWLAPGMFNPKFVAMPENHLCPYGVPGDRLWVRETWARDDEDGMLMYRADVGLGGDADQWEQNRIEGAPRYRWKPAIHMFRHASRITLEITDVRVERLQAISREDAIAEGVDWKSCPTTQSLASMRAQHAARLIGLAAHYEADIDYVGGYRTLWESINGVGSWAANPWVWAVSFRMLPASSDTQGTA